MTQKFLQVRKKLIEKDFGYMNNRQFEAITCTQGAVLVLAGAGSGKTTVLVNRIANLVKYGDAYNSDFVPFFTEQDIAIAQDYIADKTDSLPRGVFAVNAPRPWEILAITFTNKAANELKERINKKLGEGGESLWAGTFHSICGKILRMNAERIGFSSHFTVYDTDDQKRLIKNIMKDNGIALVTSYRKLKVSHRLGTEINKICVASSFKQRWLYVVYRRSIGKVGT